MAHFINVDSVPHCTGAGQSESEENLKSNFSILSHEEEKGILKYWGRRDGKNFEFCCVYSLRPLKMTPMSPPPFLCYLPGNLHLSTFAYWTFIHFQGPFCLLALVWSFSDLLVSPWFIYHWTMIIPSWYLFITDLIPSHYNEIILPHK